MSEEMKEPMQTDNDCKTEEAAASTTETMADYEDHFDDANPWNLVTKYMEEKTVLPVKVEGVVNGGVIVMIEGLRGFVPASKLSLSYIEDLETYLLKEIEVQVIDADQANNRLVLSARELLKEKEKKAREDQIANLKIGEVLEGTVETLQNYGAFIKLDNGLSGLVHVSQISQKRVKLPSDVLNAGDKVTVKVIGIKDGKISLSMKALEEVKEERQADLMELQQEIAFDNAENMIGREMLVMIEGKVADENAYVGRTYRDAPNVDGLIFINTEEELISGDFAKVKITGALEYDLIGELL